MVKAGCAGLTDDGGDGACDGVWAIPNAQCRTRADADLSRSLVLRSRLLTLPLARAVAQQRQRAAWRLPSG